MAHQFEFYEDSLIRQAIIDFVVIYNSLNSENLDTFMITEKILQLLYYNWSKILPKILQLLKFYKVFEQKIKKDKAYLECYFKLILLIKNIENLFFGIKNYLLIKDENLINKMKI